MTAFLTVIKGWLKMNSCTFAGYIGRIAERTINDKKVSTFTIGVSDGQGTLWIDCTAWGKLGEACTANLSKGSYVTVCGAVSLNPYMKDGNAAANLRLRVDRATFGPKKGKEDE